MAQILDGKKVAREIKQKLIDAISLCKKKPCLAIVQIGHDPRSDIYVRRKVLFGEQVGATVVVKKCEEHIEEGDVIELIENLNRDGSVHGIIVQLPIPEHLDKNKIIESIDIKKDVDGLKKGTGFTPATARGVMSLLHFYNVEIEGKKVVVLGRSALVGAPIARLMQSEGAEVTVCHKDTVDIIKPCREADIIVSAVGKRDLVGREHVKPGQIVIDVGINPSTSSVEGKPTIVGDTSFGEIETIVKVISPVPGGVGPMTVASLFQNLFDAYTIS